VILEKENQSGWRQGGSEAGGNPWPVADFTSDQRANDWRRRFSISISSCWLF
jgi:hypothetical protein